MNGPQPRYFVVHPGAGGASRYFWQPTQRMRAAGCKMQRLPDILAEAHYQANLLNAEWDKKRWEADAAAPKTVKLKPQKKTNLTFVYVIGGSEGSLKVGISEDPGARLKALQTAHPTGLEIHYLTTVPQAAPRQIEAAVHLALRKWRRRGEWFSCPPAIAIGAVLTAITMAIRTTQEPRV